MVVLFVFLVSVFKSRIEIFIIIVARNSVFSSGIWWFRGSGGSDSFGSRNFVCGGVGYRDVIGGN